MALKIAADFGISAFGEASEEYLQEILNPVIRNITLDENNEFKPFTEEALYNAMLGALTSGVFKGAEIAGNKLSQIKNSNNAIQNETEIEPTSQTAEQVTQPVSENTTVPVTNEQPTSEVVRPITNEQPNKVPSLKEVLQAERQNTKTSQAATSAYEYSANETLKKDIDAGLYDFIPKSSTETYNQKAAEIENTGVQNVINKYENPVETVNGKTQIKRYNDEDISEAIAAYVKASNDGNTKSQQELMAIIVDMAETSGRQTNMFKMLRKLDATGQIYGLNREFKRLNIEGEKIYGDKWNELSLTESEINTIKQGTRSEERRVGKE